jgi:4-diphosphocytidyl-2-C-methyl-D-erythritol kinase
VRALLYAKPVSFGRERRGCLESRARAKVNLYLHVIGRRDDGYHLLDSLVVFPEIGDVVRATAAPRLSLVVDGPSAAGVPADTRNSLIRAANALAAEAHLPAGAELRLWKQLPVASGIGGGSADAAAGLRVLAELWRVDFPTERLAALAASLGADVPMCLASRPAFVGGIGEVLDPVPFLPAFALLLVNPGVELATPAVFGARRGSYSYIGRFSAPPSDPVDLARLLAERGNDLTDAAISLCPAVADVLAALAELEDSLVVRMSGSGATCFALFTDVSTAERGARLMRRRYPAWWVAAAPVAGITDND